MYIVHIPHILRAAFLSPFPEMGGNCAAKF